MLSDLQWQTVELPGEWKPAVTLDLSVASAKALGEMIEEFNNHFKDLPLKPLHLKSGWYMITPQLAEELLRRNRGNRKVSLATISKYAYPISAGEWKPTGQPILINTNEQLEDAQHRLWACYLTGHSFPSYIVADVPVQHNLFAYLDDGKTRTAADALYTSGINGIAGPLAQAIKLAWKYDNKGLSITSPQPEIRNPTQPEVLTYMSDHPELETAAHRLMGTYGAAVKVIQHKGVAVFCAWKIFEHYGSDALDRFMMPLGTGANLDEGDPILALRNRMLGPDEDKLPPARRLALVIKGFNLHQSGTTVGKRGLYLRDNERYPTFGVMQTSQSIAE